MQVVDSSGNVFGAGLEVTGSDGKPKVPVINTDITIGTTVITGGVSGRVLYDNAGVVGELDLSAIYVPTSRTITINGTTQDLSANRSWTISTGITIGTTAITSGTVGRVLFQGTGNVVSQSANLFWDETNGRLAIGTSTPAYALEVKKSVAGDHGTNIQNTSNSTSARSFFQISNDTNQYAEFLLNSSTYTGSTRFGITGQAAFMDANVTTILGTIGANSLIFGTNNTERVRVFGSTGNIAIGTTTDAGYKTDINGSLRVNSSFSITSPSFAGGFSFTMNAANTLVANSSNIGTWLQVGGGNRVFIVGQEFNSTSRGNNFGNTVGGEAVGIANIIAQSSGTTALTGLTIRYAINNTGTYSGIVRGLYYNPTLTSLIGTTHRAIETVTGDVLFATTSGSLLVGTTTLAGYKADINGTGIFRSNLTIGNATSGVQYNLNFNVSFPGGGTRGGIVWSSGASILNRRKFNGGNDNTLSFLVSNSTVELLTIQEHNGTVYTQNIGINNTNPNVTAILDVASTTKGFLPPRMTTTEKNAIATPAAGLVIFDTTLNKLCVYTTAWETITSI